MFELYSGEELTDCQLKELCQFNEDDITIANQTQIYFVLVSYSKCEDIPIYLKRNLNHSYYEVLRNETNTVFIFWH